MVQQITNNSLKSLCQQHNVSYTNAVAYRRNHPQLTNQQVIKYYLSKKSNNSKNISLKQLCMLHNVNYVNARAYKHKHPQLTNQQVINFYLNKSIITNQTTGKPNTKAQILRNLCNQHKISYSTAIVYSRQNPNLTEQQVVNDILSGKVSSLQVACTQLSTI